MFAFGIFLLLFVFAIVLLMVCLNRPLKLENNYDYAVVERCGIDGVDREHAYVREKVWNAIGKPNEAGRILCKIHLPKRDREAVLEKENAELLKRLDSANKRIEYLESLYN